MVTTHWGEGLSGDGKERRHVTEEGKGKVEMGSCFKSEFSGCVLLEISSAAGSHQLTRIAAAHVHAKAAHPPTVSQVCGKFDEDRDTVPQFLAYNQTLDGRQRWDG